MLSDNETGNGLLERETVLYLVSVGYILILAGLFYSISTQSWNVFYALVFIGILLTIPLRLLT